MHERLDRELLEELKLVMEDDFALLLETFLKETEHQLFETTEAWEAGDLVRLRQSAHRLKGASSNIGAGELAGLCQRLEQLALEGRTEALDEVLIRLKAELREVRDEVALMHAAH
jgi:HPt (histidine-containing phosphotransfer) domain-containing protein